MSNMPISVVIFGSFPEAVLMLWAGLLLMGERPIIKKIIAVAILQGITSYFMHKYIGFGMYTIMWVSIFILYTHFIMKVKWSISIFAVLIPTIIVILLEGSLLIFMKINPGYLYFIEWQSLLLLLPHEIVLMVIIYFVNKNKISLLNELSWIHKLTR